MSGSSFKFALAAAAAVWALWAGHAAAQLSEDDRQVLVDFYLATGGEHWVENDGWLDPAVDPCDWYGVECQFRFEADREVIRTLELPNNNLTGELPGGDIFRVVFWRMDLSGNRIGGLLEELPRSPSRLDLSNNLLGGPLPAEQAGRADHGGVSLPNGLWHLDLSGNRFEGEVPESWSDFSFIFWLDLSDNRLEGMPEALFSRLREMPHMQGAYLNLAGNRFSGEVPAFIRDAPLVDHNGVGRWGGGINLCWNDFTVSDPDIHDWLAARHVGGENFTDCLGRARGAIDPTVSGSWYDPLRSGEGLAVQLLDWGDPLLYWFTFDDEGGQRWLVDVGVTGESHLRWRQMLETRGRFSQGRLPDDAEALERRGAFRFDRTAPGRAQVERVYVTRLENICLAIFPPQLACFGNSVSDRLEHVQLTRLAGTTCDNRDPRAWISGTWYDPERSGEGFVVEVIEDGRAVVYWFTHAPDDSGAQAWMTGLGEFVGDTLFIDNLVQPVGARFGQGFDRDQVERVFWGTLTMEFVDEFTGQIHFESVFDDYGAGSHSITRLSRPMLAECEGDTP